MGKLKSQLRTCGFWVLEIIPKFSNQRPDVVSQKIVVSGVFSMQQVFRSEEFETRRQDHDWKVFHLPSISTFIHTTLRGHPRKSWFEQEGLRSVFANFRRRCIILGRCAFIKLKRRDIETCMGIERRAILRIIGYCLENGHLFGSVVWKPWK